MNNLQAVCDAIRDTVAAKVAVAYSTSNPPSALTPAQYPVAIVTPMRGSSRLWTHNPSVLETATIRIDVLSRAEGVSTETLVTDSIDLVEPLSNALWTGYFTHKFNGTVLKMADTQDPISWEGPVLIPGYGSRAIGFRYQVMVQVEEQI